MPRPLVSDVTEAVYSALGSALTAGDDTDWLLLQLLDAAGVKAAPVDELVRDGDSPGWAALGDINTTPAVAYLLQWVGVEYRGDLTEAENRQRGVARQEAHRGTPSYLAALAREYLRGDKRVEIYERQGGRRDVLLRVFRTEVIDETRFREAVNATAVVWTLNLTVQIAAGASFAQVDDAVDTFADAKIKWPTFADMTQWLPPEDGV